MSIVKTVSYALLVSTQLFVSIHANCDVSQSFYGIANFTTGPLNGTYYNFEHGAFQADVRWFHPTTKAFSIKSYITNGQVPPSGNCLDAKSTGIWDPLHVGADSSSYHCQAYNKTLCSQATVCAVQTSTCAQGDLSGIWGDLHVYPNGTSDGDIDNGGFSTEYMSPRYTIGHALILEDSVSGTINCANIVNNDQGCQTEAQSFSQPLSASDISAKSSVASTMIQSWHLNQMLISLFMLISLSYLIL